MIELRIEGSIFGHLIGDALHSRCGSKQLSKATLLQLLARFYADAGAMTLCTMSSILESGKMDLDDIAYTFQQWYLGSYLSASDSSIVGKSTISQALRMYGNGMPAEKCGSKEEIADDSALFRMLPIALWTLNEPISEVVSQAHLTTLFTNQQITAQIYSALYCLIIRNIILQHKERATDTLEKYYSSNNMDQYSIKLKEIKNNSSKADLTKNYDVESCFWNSWYGYSQNQSSFEDVMMITLGYNNNRVNITPIAGSLAGADMGINEIPSCWIDQLSLSSEVKDIITRFQCEVEKKIK